MGLSVADNIKLYVCFSAGFAGYFDSTLYKDVHLGIEPSTATPNMFSWYSFVYLVASCPCRSSITMPLLMTCPSSSYVRFPIFFPLRRPLCIPAGSPLEVHFWRCCGATKVCCSCFLIYYPLWNFYYFLL